MKIERKKNATRNIIFGVILKLYQIFFPFVMRTAMIYFMGVKYLGLDSLFASILKVLNLAELGVGSAMVYSMYKPIVEDDKEKICALMKLYRLYYRIIGLIIAILGIIVLPFIPSLIKSDLPSELNVYVLYLLNLGATVLSYWLFAYKNCLLNAHQRIDILSKVTILTNTVQYILQLLVIYIFKDYYLFLVVGLGTQALTNIITAIVTNKMYPNYKPTGQLDKNLIININNRIKDLFTAKLGAVIVNSADTIVISTFLGLTVLAIYQNYFYILTSIIGIVTIIFNSCTAGIGNSIIVDSEEKNFNDLKKFTFLISWIAGFCSTCLLCLYQPFMEIWVGKDLMLNMSAVVCLCIYYYIYEINQLLNTYKDAAGIWHEDRFRPLITALSNLALNLILVNIYGIYGVILSTVLSMILIGMPWLLHNLFTVLFHRRYLKSYLNNLFFYAIVSFTGCVVTGVLCTFINLDNNWITLILRGIVCCILPNFIFFIAYYKRKEFKECVYLLDSITKHRLHLQNKIERIKKYDSY